MANFFSDNNVNRKWKISFGLVLILAIISRRVLRFFSDKNSYLIDIIPLIMSILGLVFILRISWLYNSKREKLQ